MKEDKVVLEIDDVVLKAEELYQIMKDFCGSEFSKNPHCETCPLHHLQGNNICFLYDVLISDIRMMTKICYVCHNSLIWEKGRAVIGSVIDFGPDTHRVCESWIECQQTPDKYKILVDN
jgi:hypothetical protein